MSLENIANISATYGIVSANPDDDPVAIVVPTTILPATTVFAPDGVPVMHTSVVVSLHTITAPNATFPDLNATIPDPNFTPSTPLVVTILPLAQKIFVDGSLVPMRENDTSILLNAVPLVPDVPDPKPYPIAFYVTIKNAGQNKVKAL